MFRIMEGLPDDVLGVDATGTITHADYRDVLIPAAKKKLEGRQKIKMLYVAGLAFKGYEAGAMWDDAAFGMAHWKEFGSIAIVTDVGWLGTAARVFAPFFPGAVKLFPMTGLDAAKAWLAAAKE